MKSTEYSPFVMAISSRALFNLEEENRIFEQEGEKAYMQYQQEHEKEILLPGNAFPLVKSFMNLNRLLPGEKQIEIIIVSRNNADSGLRIFNSIEHYQLGITRAAFTSGQPVHEYLKAFGVVLFLSANEDDVRHALQHSIPAGLIYPSFLPSFSSPEEEDNSCIRIAFDGDAVIFSEEAELIYQRKGLDAFIEHENKKAGTPLPEGPFARLLRHLSFLQHELKDGHRYIRTALITARSSPSHERVIRTLRKWKIRIDEMFFLGNFSKQPILQAFRPHIFFDDQEIHCRPASLVVPTARVPNSNVEKDARERKNTQRKK